MRIAGLNAVGILLAAVAIYAIGFIWYGLVFADLWTKLSGYETPAAAEAAFAPHLWRMALGPVMPVLIAIVMAIVFKRLNVTTLAAGLSTAALLWFGFSFTARLYLYAYGVEPVGLLAIDAAHGLLGHLAAGAVLSRFR